MHFIKAHSLRLESFWDERAPEYAIISHRWEDEEVSFQDMQNLEVASTKQGFLKIRQACRTAIRNGYNYVWMDTCCINKESSAELSEAINSMYQWYKGAAVCYAFLSDVRTTESDHAVEEEMKSSKWFTRGWTLQELLAPLDVIFYNQRWEYLGTKLELTTLLTLCTGIDEAILSNQVPLSSRSIAQRMSWASQRTTTRTEDAAYCLLGIFDVAMPLLYGERGKAFIRLQEEILKKSTDHSLFAWPIHRKNQPGLLADGPAAFAGCQHVVIRSTHLNRFRTILAGIPSPKQMEKPYSMTNRGLSIRMMAVQIEPDTYRVSLNCGDEALPTVGSSSQNARGETYLGMYMRRLYDDDQYARIKYKGETFVNLRRGLWEGPDTEYATTGQARQPVGYIDLNVPQEFANTDAELCSKSGGSFRLLDLKLSHGSQPRLGGQQFEVLANRWSLEGKTLYVQPGEFGTVRFLNTEKVDDIKTIELGYDFDGNPLCSIKTTEEVQETETTSERNQQVQEKVEWNDFFIGSVHPTELTQGVLNLKGDRHLGMNLEFGHVASLSMFRVLSKRSWSWHIRYSRLQ